MRAESKPTLTKPQTPSFVRRAKSVRAKSAASSEAIELERIQVGAGRAVAELRPLLL
jgi:hypothetical protein